jgi:hypothetical protein
MNTMEGEDKSRSKSFLQNIGKGLVDDGRSCLRWMGVGAVIGAAIIGAVGAYYFGLTGLGYGAGIGAVVGGAVGWWLYFGG